ncbi:MAG TPA: A/G-specific adenine glycosylase [Crocinitomicaceae bacterium]|nr:A/G-specific adenine glycosylase [Crocinitomicaceae bacterium]
MSDFSLSIQAWYRQNKRDLPWRNTSDPYFIWLSEIIMQQTRVEQGRGYYLKFRNHYPTVQDLATAEEQEVLNDWQGLGYYSRARNLHFSAKYICDDLNGVFPPTFEEILTLKGVGQYTAAAISSFAYNECQAVVDGNVYRLLSRVFDIDLAIDSTEGKKYFQQLAQELIDCTSPGEHNQAIMEVGAMICKPSNPNCEECPLQEKCLAFSNNTIPLRPVKTKKIKVRKRYFHFLIYKNDGQLLIEQRIEKDIWKNMYQFPLIETKELVTKEDAQVWSNQKLESKQIKHILSHQRIIAIFHHFDSIPEFLKKKYTLIKIDEIQDYPLPRIIDKYLNDFSELF